MPKGAKKSAGSLVCSVQESSPAAVTTIKLRRDGKFDLNVKINITTNLEAKLIGILGFEGDAPDISHSMDVSDYQFDPGEDPGVLFSFDGTDSEAPLFSKLIRLDDLPGKWITLWWSYNTGGDSADNVKLFWTA